MRSTGWRLLLGALALAAAFAAGCAEPTPEEHDHSTHTHEEDSSNAPSMSMDSAGGGHVMVASVEAPADMSVAFEARPDAVSGLNIRLTTTGFTFTPEAANAEDVPGEGHAHIYVDGVKITRLYGPDYHLTAVEPGEREIRVSLNTNSHADYVRGTRLVDAVQTVPVPETGGGHTHAADDAVEAPSDMGVSLHVEPDAHSAGGFNVRIDASGFAFAPDSVNREHVAGEGHAHIYVDGAKIGRVYSPWFFLGGLAPGEHEVRVTLTANTHQPYERDGEPLAASAVVTVQ